MCEIRGVVSKFFEQKKNKYQFFGWSVKNGMSTYISGYTGPGCIIFRKAVDIDFIHFVKYLCLINMFVFTFAYL